METEIKNIIDKKEGNSNKLNYYSLFKKYAFFMSFIILIFFIMSYFVNINNGTDLEQNELLLKINKLQYKYDSLLKYQNKTPLINIKNNVDSNSIKLNEIKKEIEKYKQTDAQLNLKIKKMTDTLSRLKKNSNYVEKNIKLRTDTTHNKLVHIVKQGESLFSISKQYNISIETIKHLNTLSSDTIKIGSIIKLE